MIRLIVGAGILAAGVAFHNPWGAIGIVPFLTGLFRFCPAYTLLGIRSK